MRKKIPAKVFRFQAHFFFVKFPAQFCFKEFKKKTLFFMSFKRTIEDFTCEHCKAKVKGNGYTNHCPKCLWSKHADINPGDRAAVCGGAMEPIAVSIRRGEQVIVHRCVLCSFTRRQTANPADDTARTAELSANPI